MVYGYKLQQTFECHSDMWAAYVFITKPVTTNLFIFIEKCRQKTLCLVCRKIILGFDKKENYDMEKSFIWPSC